MNIINEFYKIEKETLSKYATLSQNSKGRKFPILEDGIRNPFQRDRDRIIHSKAFRRLKHKTQVFLSPEGDHYRTRLTHTLEVSQIARTIGRALRLQEDLIEAISLGHDLGHTPFGHEGERILNSITGSFSHAKQSVRVVTFLENDGKGLNLTKEVIDGILNHGSESTPSTLEGKVVSYADRIAYINHDIDDAIRANIITENDLPKNCTKILGTTKGKRIETLVLDIIKSSYDKNDILLDNTVEQALINLRKFMFENIYKNNVAKEEEKKVNNILYLLYDYYIKHITELPLFYQSIAASEGDSQAVTDYISGMTDRFAIKSFSKIYIPGGWDKI